MSSILIKQEVGFYLHREGPNLGKHLCPLLPVTISLDAHIGTPYPRCAGFDTNNGCGALLWEDRWLNGYRLHELAPRAYGHILARVQMVRTVFEASNKGRWATDVGSSLNMEEAAEYLLIWPTITAVQLDDQHVDRIVWSWEKDDAFSVKSAYIAKFATREVSSTATFTWRSRSLFRCHFFAWLAIMNRC